MEEDSFKGRVDKIFGSLSSSKSSQSPSIAPLWSLTDDEVERREWNRRKDNPDRDDETPCSSSFDGLFMKDRKVTAKQSRNVRDKLEDPSDDEDEEDDDNEGKRFGSGLSKRGNDDDEEEWDIRSSIGLDCTLDNEEEEDVYDKMAEGRENYGDRLYMKDVTDHGPYLNSHNVLPTSVDDSLTEPCANHHAAKIRLKEDETVTTDTEKHGSTLARDKSMLKAQEPCLIEREDGVKVKSILKRKSDIAVKSSKRVKFDATCKDEYEQASKKYQDALTCLSSTGTKGEGDDSTSVKSRVPDYILNPLKYTQHSFDSSNINEESNIQACMDFLGQIKRSNPSALENKVDHQKSVVFIPRKKASDSKQIDGSSNGKSKQSLTQASSAVGVAAGEVQHDDACVMEEDEPDIAATCTNATFQKSGRRYRIKSGSEETSS